MTKYTLSKIASIALSAIMISGLAAIPVSAAKNPGVAASSVSAQDEMKAALTKVKQRVTIPSELSEFTYTEDKSHIFKSYSFKWSTPDDAKEYKYMTIAISNNVIYSYNTNYLDKDFYTDTPTFAKLSEDELLAKAKEHFKKFNPDLISEAEFEIDSIGLKNKYAKIKINRVVNGVTDIYDTGTISLDKDTGELINFSFSWLEDAEFASPKDAISEEEANKAFKDLSNITPVYVISYDENEEPVAKLVYRSDFSEFINAYDGTVSTFNDDASKNAAYYTLPFGKYLYFDYAIEEEAATEATENSAEGGVTFTPEELKEIEASKEILSADDVLKLLQNDKYIKLSSSYTLSSSNVYKNTKTDEYFANYRYTTKKNNVQGIYDTLRVNINAKTGEIISFDSNIGKTLDNTKKYPLSENIKIAEAAAEHYCKDIASGYKLSEQSKEEPDFWVDNDGKKHYPTSKIFYFNRYVNNVIVEDDYISITIDSTGKVISFSFNHSDVKSFPAVTKYDKDNAFESFFKDNKLELQYCTYVTKSGSISTYLVYKTKCFYTDSKYNLVDYYGNELNEEFTGYTDIKGIPQEKAVKILEMHGVYLTEGSNKLSPKTKITENEFTSLLSQIFNSYIPYYAVTNELADEEDTGNKVLTNMSAAKLFVNQLGGSQFAELKGIYKSVFTDLPATDENVGYAAIAKASGLFTGSKLEPNKELTRAEAMQMLYNYISTNS